MTNWKLVTVSRKGGWARGGASGFKSTIPMETGRRKKTSQNNCMARRQLSGDIIHAYGHYECLTESALVRIQWNSDNLSFIRSTGVDFEWSWNKFLTVLVIRILLGKKFLYSQSSTWPKRWVNWVPKQMHRLWFKSTLLRGLLVSIKKLHHHAALPRQSLKTAYLTGPAKQM